MNTEIVFVNAGTNFPSASFSKLVISKSKSAPLPLSYTFATLPLFTYWVFVFNGRKIVFLYSPWSSIIGLKFGIPGHSVSAVNTSVL
jgi:hypothetical protein